MDIREKAIPDDRNLGLTQCSCKLCHASGMFQTYLVREMMQDTKEEFEYFICEQCSALQIKNIPENLGDYYGRNYYSFSHKLNNTQFENDVINQRKILDVGCGNGELLVNLANRGFGNLYGCDPFIEEDVKYGDRITIFKKSIHEMTIDNFDEIILCDSFEHMLDPIEALQSAAKLLAKDGILTMRIPFYPNIAMDLFGTDWYQWDAPRHIFIHSFKSLLFIENQVPLKMKSLRFDSNKYQFIDSYLYQKDIPYSEHTFEVIDSFLTKEEQEEFIRLTEENNQKNYGDHVQIEWEKL